MLAISNVYCTYLSFYFKMIQPDDSDMLPRPAPKPSASPHEEMCKPTVPEVSLLDVASKPQHQQNQNPLNQKKMQSYAAWKQQMLPKVVYAPMAMKHENAQLNELYPLRPPISNMSPLSNEHNGYYARSVASAPPLFTADPNPLFSRPYTAPQMPLPSSYDAYQLSLQQPQQQMQNGQQIRSLDALNHVAYDAASSRSPRVLITSCETLTICASTQTEPVNSTTDCATKTDIAELLLTMQEMREHQMRHMQMCEVLLMQQQQQQQQLQSAQNIRKAQQVDAATQYNIEGTEPAAVVSQPVNKVASWPKFLSPRLPPAAQSTGYQTNTPAAILRQKIAATQAKATDKTLTMNELALKYLPDDKLNELLNDLHLSAAANALTERDVATAKAATDMSNASYKYLQKYRLLPIEANTPTSNNVRFQRADSPNSQPVSPYEQRATDSPILIRRPRSEGDDMLDEIDTLNLEELRNRPKFL